MKPKVVSLFSGCGGMDIGFKTAGYQIILSTDNWPIAVETLKNNTQGKQEILCSDIGEVNFKRIKKRHGEIDVLIGGPPCPPFLPHCWAWLKVFQAICLPQGSATALLPVRRTR